MAVRIRLRRMGAKKQPFYRVVVADSRSPRDGRFLDTIGTYNPRSEPVDIRIDREKALQWLAEGAEPTDSVRSLLSKAGIWQEFKTGERPEEKPRPTPATPAERTAPEPETVEAPEEVETEIDREMAAAGESEETAAEGPPVATAEEEVAEAGEEAAEAGLEGVETEEAEAAGEGEAPAEGEEEK